MRGTHKIEKQTLSWALYDWGNSAYATTVIADSHAAGCQGAGVGSLPFKARLADGGQTLRIQVRAAGFEGCSVRLKPDWNPSLRYQRANWFSTLAQRAAYRRNGR